MVCDTESAPTTCAPTYATSCKRAARHTLELETQEAARVSADWVGCGRVTHGAAAGQ